MSAKINIGRFEASTVVCNVVTIRPTYAGEPEFQPLNGKPYKTFLAKAGLFVCLAILVCKRPPSIHHPGDRDSTIERETQRHGLQPLPTEAWMSASSPWSIRLRVRILATNPFRQGLTVLVFAIFEIGRLNILLEFFRTFLDAFNIDGTSAQNGCCHQQDGSKAQHPQKLQLFSILNQRKNCFAAT